ncbi:hypothetical protein [Rhodohalobacter sulfatireducens]|uniref:SGNH/GDSL hydrolase family protein n=1 Tax=Rhodohalobacter sulfatireducens TaxID=2911366 RepID=A0ABS9KJ17_9BACT|nr:hypothetical protein [Rhodohalobacter sulfatireducens]MCG2590797.1 hypothetical protein [Rhodohalobacter sulfatireducens]
MFTRRLNSPFIYLLGFISLFLGADYLVHKGIQTGLEKYYGISSENEIAFVGHSHLMLGVDKERFEEEIGKKVSKYTIEGVNVYDRYLMLNHLMDENKNLKTIVYGVNPWMFTGSGLSENSYQLFLPFMNNELIGNYVKKEMDGFEYWQKKIIKSSRYNERLVSGSMRGYLGIWSNLKFGNLDPEKYRKRIENGDYRQINSLETNRNIFEKSINELTSQGINVVLLYVPTTDLYNDLEPREFSNELDYFRKIEKENDRVLYFEYLNGWESNYDLFFDPIHLNPEGQALLTEQFISDIEKNEEKLSP